MKIEKAIEILEIEANLSLKQPETGIYDALKLGIEALKLVKKCRHSPNSWFVKELPGETK